MKAEDLQKANNAMSAQQQLLYDYELKKCFDHIERVHSLCNVLYTFYPVPLAIAAEPLYDWEKCVAFMRTTLKANGYYVRIYKDARTLFISWDPAIAKKGKDIECNVHNREDRSEGTSSKIKSESQPQQNLKSTKKGPEVVIDFNPANPLSQLNLRATLMANNPKYQHLKSIHAASRK